MLTNPATLEGVSKACQATIQWQQWLAIAAGTIRAPREQLALNTIEGSPQQIMQDTPALVDVYIFTLSFGTEPIKKTSTFPCFRD